MSRLSPTYKIIVPFLALFFATVTVLRAQVQNDTIDQIQELRKEASNAILIEDFDTALSSIENANNLAGLVNDAETKADVLITSSELLYFLQNYKKAASESAKAIAFLKKTTDKNKIAKAYSLRGLILIQLNDYANAERYLKDADDLFTQLNDEKRQSNVLLGMGLLELKRGKPKSAVNYFDAAIPLYQDYKLTFQETSAQINKANALIKLGAQTGEDNTVRAKEALTAANQLLKTNSYPKLEIESYKLASHIAIKEGDFQSAENNLNLYAAKKDSLNQIYTNVLSKSADIEHEGGKNEVLGEYSP